MTAQRTTDNLNFEEARYAMAEILVNRYGHESPKNMRALAKSINRKFYGGRSRVTEATARAFTRNAKKNKLTVHDFERTWTDDTYEAHLRHGKTTAVN
jgi:hypothetical protein